MYTPYLDQINQHDNSFMILYTFSLVSEMKDGGMDVYLCILDLFQYKIN